MSEQQIEKWQRWINDPIQPAVLTMFHHRAIYLGLNEIIGAHGSLPDSAFWPYHRNVYAGSQSVAVRKQVDLHKDVASLGKLLSELADHPTALTAEWWVGMWRTQDAYDKRLARSQWEENYGKGSEHLDPDLPARDLAYLRNETESVKEYVDKYVAHSEYRGNQPAISLPFNDIHRAIDIIGEVFRRYYNLLTATDMVELEPIIQHDWRAPFRQPWIRPDDEPLMPQ